MIDRATPGDLMTLAADHGPLPMNIAAVLLLDSEADIGTELGLSSLAAMLSARIGAVPRLRQRLVRMPVGCGRPVWIDDPKFELARHLSEVSLPAPGTHADLLQAAGSAACDRLDPDRPLWSVRLITGVQGGRAALVIAMHHVLADGIGGLAVLAALVDAPVPHGHARSSSSSTPQAGWSPQAPPSRATLAREAARSRMNRLAQIPRAISGIGTWAGGFRELGLGAHRPVVAPVTSLNRPTGGRRRLTTVEASRSEIVAAAHRAQCTVNDIMLAAVTGALAAVLQRRGESPPDLVISIPVSTRRATTASELGNHTGVLPLRIPLIAAPQDRLSHIAGLTRNWRAGPRGESAAPMAAGFRLLAALRLFQPFVNHQRFVNTFVTNVRGPEEFVELAGHRVLAVIPVAVVPGNVGVAFDVLSYADQLIITIVADPELVPDQAFLTEALTNQLAVLVGDDLAGSYGHQM